jgi:hypothetical protein
MAEGDIDPEDMDDLGDLDGPDDDDEGDEDGPDDDEGQGKDGDGKDWKPPTKAEWERAQRRLKKYAADKRGKGGAEVDRKLAAQLRGKAGKDDDESDSSEASEEAQRWRRTAAQQSAAASLTAAGFNGTARQAARLTRLLDLDNAEPDSDGVFDWEDDVEELKEEYPELFGARGSRRNEGGGRLPKVRTAPNRDGAPKDDPTQRTSDALLRAAGFTTRTRRRTG